MMSRSKTLHLSLALAAIAPFPASAANFCVAVAGGFGHGGTSFIAPSFSVPAAGICKSWAGFTKTASTVIAFANGTGCLSTNGKVLTLSIFNTDPANFGANKSVSDQIQLCPEGTVNCPITGRDQGNFGGSAKEQTCTDTLLSFPVNHD